ncbi:MAG: hypothetical protein JNK29_12230 [Anaerolineales bacterium]|nr:hypothetical protein [Anaerolineales bacterium]
MRTRLIASVLVICLCAAGFWYVTRAPAGPAPTPPAGPTPDLSGFARALAPRDFAFPLDHGPHFDYQTEWWYYTGNLTAETGEHFGFQLTFFRRGLTPGAPAAPAGLSTNQIYFAHFALTDVAGGQHRGVERFSRGAGGLAGASGAPFQVWLEDWRAEALNADGSAVRVRAREGDALGLDLDLRAVKPIVAHGDRGLSPKSEQPGNASYYLSYTRLAADGTITARGQTFRVSGSAWFDHEWSTSALGPQGLGWDWFSLQLSDGRELMFFQIRRADGGIEAVSGGTLVEPDGRTTRLPAAAVQIDVLATWTSPATRSQYPARWRISVPEAQLELEVEPWLPAQEMQLTFTYWEGAVKVTGLSAGAPVAGDGYVELTGYSGSMQGVF